MHTAIMSGVLTATWPCSGGTLQQPHTRPGGTVPGPPVLSPRCVRVIRREQRQGLPGPQPALWVPRRWKIPMTSPEGIGGGLEGSLFSAPLAWAKQH